MRRLLLLVATALALFTTEAQAQQLGTISCGRSTYGSAAGVVVAAAAGRNIATCGWFAQSNTAGGAWTISYGTGTTCGTNNVVIFTATGMPAGADIDDHLMVAFLQIPAGNDLCVSTSTTMNWIVYWTQF